jgi:hypothetical protein
MSAFLGGVSGLISSIISRKPPSLPRIATSTGFRRLTISTLCSSGMMGMRFLFSALAQRRILETIFGEASR